MTGRHAEAMELDEGEYRRLTERGQSGLLPPLLQAMATTRLFSGRPDLAERYAGEIDDLVEQGEEFWRERARMPRAWILAYAGELDAARRLALAALSRQEAEGDLWEATIWRTILGFVEISVPDPTSALAVLGRALEQADAMKIGLPNAFAFLGDYVEAAVLAGRVDLAEAAVRDRLEMAARGRGLIEAAAGRHDGAVAEYSRALEVLENRSGLPLDRGRILLLRGEARRRLGQRRAARSDLEAATEVFDALGAAVWAGRAREELGRLGGRAPARLALTVTERTVAELAATGLTNREIAARLVVSVRTVESQLSAVYRKLDIRSRAGLRDALAATAEA
jgi:DNA-binding CsgD family transcriptional regulator